jgi:DEAD/DEAH box helicase domain-containing protein
MAATQQSSYNLKNIIEQSIDYLRSRHHPEKSHISALSPSPIPIAMNLWQGIVPQCQPSISGEEEEEEDIEEFIEEFYSSRNPGHVFGVDLLNADLGSGGVSFAFSFYVRTSYDFDDESKWREDAYTKVTINGMVDRGANKITYYVKVEPGDHNKQKWASSMLNIPLEIPINNDCLITSLILLPLNQQESQQFVGKYVHYVFKQVASINLPREYREYTERHFILNVGSGGAYSLGSNITAVPIGILNSNPWMSLVGEVYDKSGNLAGYYYPAFGIVLGLCKTGDNYVVKSYLVNLGGVLRIKSPSYKGEAVNDYCRRYWVFTWNGQEDTRWALGHLLEVEGRVEALHGARLNVQWDAEKGGLLNAYVYNAMLICEDIACNRSKLIDYHVEEEVLPPIKRSNRKVKDYFEYLLSKLNINDDCKRKLSPLFDALANILSNIYGVHELYEYQEQAIEEVLASQGLINKPGAKDKIVITARTAGGKTFAFLIPAIIVSAYKKLCRGEGVGVKAILMYPTKALANDQVEEVAHMLYYLHDYVMRQWSTSTELTFGVLHGNIKHRAELQKLQQTQQQKLLLPMHCPIHGEPVEYDIGSGVVICNKGGSSCPFASFVSKYMRITRDDIYGEPPDILVTDEDMMNRILSGMGSGPPYWFEWSILGSPYKRCPHCGFTYPPNWRNRTCSNCKADISNVKPITNVSKPSLIVLDEAHMLTGSFGAQVHHMLSLLEYVINKLSGAMRHKITYVMASATMGNPEEFAASIFGVGRGDVKVIQAEVETGAVVGGHRRYFAFVMPKAYTIDATTVRLIASFIREYKNAVSSVPKGVIFTNFLDESNELLHSLKIDGEVGQSIAPDRIGGHSTDYEQDRVNVENEFKKGNLDVLVATSTLELGIDYGVIDFVAIYGMPNTLTSYIQRIGRAGRNKDAVVFTIFDPERRIDHYFFENYKLLSDGKMRETALKRETYPVGASNEEAVRRAVRRFVTAAVKLCCAMGNCPGSIDACHAIVDGVGAGRRQAFWSFMVNYLSTLFSNNDIPSGIINLRSIPLIQTVINNEIAQIQQRMTQNAGGIRDLSNLINDVLGGDEPLYNLRAADVSVTFEFNKLPKPYNLRYRELRYAIKHALLGQVVSYRGYFFASKYLRYKISKISEFFAGV